MKTIIAGGRNYQFTDDDIAWLDAINRSGWRITEVVSGGAKGADFEGELWAERRGIPVKWFPADWDKHGRAAGPIRNKEMADYADALIAFPGGRGTQNMIDIATRSGLEVCKLGWGGKRMKFNNNSVINPRSNYNSMLFIEGC